MGIAPSCTSMTEDHNSVKPDSAFKETVFENRKPIDAQWSQIIEAYCADARVTLERILPDNAASS